LVNYALAPLLPPKGKIREMASLLQKGVGHDNIGKFTFLIYLLTYNPIDVILAPN
jgi:hypothetical protein